MKLSDESSSGQMLRVTHTQCAHAKYLLLCFRRILMFSTWACTEWLLFVLWLLSGRGFIGPTLVILLFSPPYLSPVYVTCVHEGKNYKKKMEPDQKDMKLKPTLVVSSNIGMYDRDGGSLKKTAKLNRATGMTSDKWAAALDLTDKLTSGDFLWQTLSNMSWKGRTPGTEMTAPATTLMQPPPPPQKKETKESPPTHTHTDTRPLLLCIWWTKPPSYFVLLYITPVVPISALFSWYFTNNGGSTSSDS